MDKLWYAKIPKVRVPSIIFEDKQDFPIQGKNWQRKIFSVNTVKVF